MLVRADGVSCNDVARLSRRLTASPGERGISLSTASIGTRDAGLGEENLVSLHNHAGAASGDSFLVPNREGIKIPVYITHDGFGVVLTSEFDSVYFGSATSSAVIIAEVDGRGGYTATFTANNDDDHVSGYLSLFAQTLAFAGSSLALSGAEGVYFEFGSVRDLARMLI